PAAVRPSLDADPEAEGRGRGVVLPATIAVEREVAVAGGAAEPAHLVQQERGPRAVELEVVARFGGASREPRGVRVVQRLGLAREVGLAVDQRCESEPAARAPEA